jgi:hypothetical protein
MPQDKTVVQEIVTEDGAQTHEAIIILPEASTELNQAEAGRHQLDVSASTQQQATEVKAKKSTKGEVFYKYFQTQIDGQILNKFEDFIKPLMSLLQNNPIVFHILLSLIDKHIKTRAVTPVAQRRAFLRYANSHTRELGHLMTVHSSPPPPPHAKLASASPAAPRGVDSHGVDERAEGKRARVSAEAVDARCALHPFIGQLVLGQ